MDIKDFIPIDWKEQRVITSAQLAEAYECSPKNISDNFNRAKDYFQEDVHYFCLTGMQLEQFRLYSEKIGLQISAKTRKLYLWTYQGCVRHCKMINTPKAWLMFDKLEKNYFNQPRLMSAEPVVSAPAPVVTRVKKLDLARVYLFLMSDGTVQIVKIGHSNNIRSRVAKIERETGLKVVDMYFTPEMPRKDARLVEWASQKKLAPQRVRGEFFSADFDEARAIIDYFVKITTATLPPEYLNRIADKQD